MKTRVDRFALSYWFNSVCTGATALLVLSHQLVTAAPAAPQSNQQIGQFVPIATYQVSGEAAEIVAATPDGNFLVYTDSETEGVGIVDIRDPANPTEVRTIPMAGVPTSVAITPNGRWALAVVHGAPDHLAVIDLTNPNAGTVILILDGQPDSIAISRDGRYAAVAIENERNEDVDGGALPQDPAGFLAIVDLVGTPAAWNIRSVSLVGLASRFSDDPEPEFVDINASNQAAVTLQENNHVVIVDLPTGDIVSHFSAGAVTQLADLQSDDQVIFDDVLTESRREPDAIGWTPNGLLVTANEGDYDVDTDWVGGRSFTIFSPDGEVVYDSGAELEFHLAAAGLYDDRRSGSKGSEPEGIEVAVFGNHTFLFVGMERGAPGAVAVYRLNGQNENPQFVQMLATGNRPEGLLAIPQRGLFVTANEGDGTISIFSGRAGR